MRNAKTYLMRGKRGPLSPSRHRAWGTVDGTVVPRANSAATASKVLHYDGHGQQQWRRRRRTMRAGNETSRHERSHGRTFQMSQRRWAGHRDVCPQASSQDDPPVPMTGMVPLARSTIATASEVQEIAKLHAVRLTPVGEPGTMPPRFMPEYLVEWRDADLAPSWELATDIAEDALRDFEKEWWTAVKAADARALRKLGKLGSLELLSGQPDKDGRIALHYIAGRGDIECAEMIIEAARRMSGDASGGGLIDAADKDGYTPLHLAAGYMHSDFLLFMLGEGADPELKDKAGRTVVDLVADLWKRMPGGPAYLDKRMKLNAIREKIDAVLFEEVLPERILDRRAVGSEDKERDQGEESGSGAPASVIGARGDKPSIEYLVQWRGSRESDDGEEESSGWVPSSYLSAQLRQDYDNDIEYCDAARLLDRRVERIVYKGRDRTRTRYLVEWQDGREASWEPLSHVTAALVEEYEDAIGRDEDRAVFDDELDELEDAERAAEEAADLKKDRDQRKMEEVTY